MKVYDVPELYGSFGVSKFNDGLLRCEVQCAGTSLVSAAQPPTVDFAKLFQQIIVATYVDASNFALVLPSLAYPSDAQIEVYAMGPNGVDITVFLQGGNAFVDGSVSINIPTGTGKKFVKIGFSDPPPTTIIGVMG